MSKFEVGQRVRVRESEIDPSQVDNLYPGEEGEVVGYDSGFTRVRIDNVRDDDTVGLALIERDGGWLYAYNELEAI